MLFICFLKVIICNKTYLLENKLYHLQESIVSFTLISVSHKSLLGQQKLFSKSPQLKVIFKEKMYFLIRSVQMALPSAGAPF